jgi:hypothetical protein
MAYLAKNPYDDQTDSQSQDLQSQGRSNAGQSQGTTAQPSAGQTSAKAPADFTRSNFSNATDILQRNQGADVSSITNRLLGNTKQNAEATNKQISDRTAQYRTDTNKQIEDTYRAPDASFIGKALGGDANAESQITSSLGRKADQVKGIDLGQLQSIAPSEFFQQGEYQPLLQSRSKGNYTSGMGALDASLFNRSGGAEDIRNTVGRLQTGVNENAANALKATDEEQAYANQYLGGQQASLKDLIAKAAGGIKSEIAGRVDPAKQAAKDLIASKTQEYTTQQKSAVQKAIDDFNKRLEYGKKLGAVDEQFGSNLAQKQMAQYNTLDPNKYLNVQNPDLGESDFVQQADADKFNKLMGWVGSGDSLAPSAAQKQASVGFDQTGFDQWLGGANQSQESQLLDAYIKKQEGLNRANKIVQGVGNGDPGAVVEAQTGGNRGVTGGGTKEKSGGTNKSFVDKAADKVRSWF